jgi:hypothetical protein
LAAVRSRPTRRGVGGRHELRGDLGRGSESSVVEDSQILTNCSASGLRWKSFVAFDPLLPIGIGLDQARIDRESFSADQSLLNTATQDALEHATKEVALPEPAMPVLGERRVIRYRSIQTKPAEPPVGQVEVDVITQPSFRSNAKAVTDQEHPDHQFGIDRRSTDTTIERRQLLPDLLKVNEPID